MLRHERLFVIAWTAACQASLSITNSRSLHKFMCIQSVIPSNQLILCHPLILLVLAGQSQTFNSLIEMDLHLSASFQFGCSVVSNSLQLHGLQRARPLCPSPIPRAYSNSGPSCQWGHPTSSSSVIHFPSHLQSFPESGSFPIGQFFTSGSQSIGVSASASVLPMNTQDWSPLGLTGWISLKSKGLSRVFSNTTVQKHQFFGAQFSL